MERGFKTGSLAFFAADFGTFHHPDNHFHFNRHGLGFFAGEHFHFQFGFELGVIKNDKTWITMIHDRNETVHLYDRSNAEAVFANVKAVYLPEFVTFVATLDAMA